MGKHYVDGIADIISEKVNIVDLVGSYLQLKKTGRNYKALCPFHSEKTPSFVVSEEKQIFHCFGCGASGSVISFVMQIENLDFIDAIEQIGDRYGIDLDEYLVKKYDTKGHEEQEKLFIINKVAAKGFYNNLKSNKNAYEYLINRNLKPQTMRKFGLGFAPDEWDFILKNLGKKFTDNILEKSGLIIKRDNSTGHYDRFRNRIMFPIFDIRGRVIGFGGRVMDDTMPKYLNSPDTPIFNKSFNLYGMNYAKNYSGENKQIVIVEGYMDVISLYDKGIYNVAASLGTSLTEGHGKLIERYAKEVVLLYDSDQAGIKATRRAIDVLRPFSVRVKVLSLKEGLDPDEYVLKYGKDELQKLIDGSQDAMEYMLDYYKEDLSFSIKADIVEYIDRIRPLFSGINNTIEYELYVKRVSEETGLSLANLVKELKYVKKIEKENDKLEEVVLQSKDVKLYQRLFEIFINERNYLDLLKKRHDFNEFHFKILEEVTDFILLYDEIDINKSIDVLSFEEIEMLRIAINTNEYIKVSNGIKEVEKMYFELLLSDKV
ncbi:MAG: DNA primase, partial [Bacillota bacterium]|nr:DNA primase [Bacillota bacterium]